MLGIQTWLAEGIAKTLNDIYSGVSVVSPSHCDDNACHEECELTFESVKVGYGRFVDAKFIYHEPHRDSARYRRYDPGLNASN